MELHVERGRGRCGQGKGRPDRPTFSVAAYPNRTFEARITQARYGSSTTSGVVTYETVLKVNNSDLSLRPGMTATADITVKKVENALLIPSAALRFTPPAQEEKKEKSSGGLVSSLLPRPPRSGYPTAQWRDGQQKAAAGLDVLKDGQLSAVPVTIGSTNGSMTEVVAGEIQPGMAVVVDIVSAE